MVLRHKENFIVPFIYKDNYEELCNNINGNEYFRKIEELKETELHAFINRRFWQEDNGHCAVFLVNANCGRDALISLYDTEQDLDIKISDIRLYIFKSGIMFMVISAEYTRGKSGFSLYAAEETNAALKDLYTHKGRFVRFDKNLRLVQNLDENIFDNVFGELEKIGTKDENGIQKITLTLKKSAKEEIRVENSVALFKNKDTGEFIDFENGLFAPVKSKANMIKCYKKGDVSLACVIDTVLSKINIKELDSYFESSDNNKLPKKAVVFNLHVLDNDKQFDVKEQLFYLAHGYTHSYKYSKSGENIISTFDNSYWKITREGAANMNLIESEDHFLHHEFENKFDTIYLWILLLVLHQYYGLQYFTCELLKIYQKSLQEEKKNKKKEFSQYLADMERIKNKGDLFLLQYSFADISQISHQNDIYTHICNVYNIKGLISDYKTNADICGKVLEQKRQKSLQSKVTFLARISTFFTLFTAITQTTMGLVELGSTFSLVLRILLGIAGIGLVVIGLFKNK